MWDLLLAPFMIRAIIAAAVTGLAAPGIGTYLVQRRLSLMGDGIGHITVTGVALGLLTGTSPTFTAVVVAVLGALADRADPHVRQGHRRPRPGAAVLRRHRRRPACWCSWPGTVPSRSRPTSSARSPRSRRATWSSRSCSPAS